MYTTSNTDPTKDDIKGAIEYNEKKRSHYNKLEKYYEGNHGILERKKSDTLKNTKVVINHAEYITDVNVGYLLGIPVDYQLEEDKEGTDQETEKKDLETVIEQYKKQTISDLDHEIGTDVSIFGIAYEHIYNDINSEPRSAKLDPRNCIIVYDDTVEHKKLYAIKYSIKDSSTKENPQYEEIEVLTDKQIIEYDPVKFVATNIVEHYFGFVPVVEYRNNAKNKSDFYSVISLIDAYNILQSDRINDKEQLVEAILILYGIVLTPEILTDLKVNRVLSAPGKLNGLGAEYLVKNLNETDVDVLRAKIESDIHKISKTPNLSDENFAGNSSGVAIRYKLIVFEMNIQNKERYFEKSLKERFKIYNNFLNLKNQVQTLIPTYKLDVVFKRSLPMNDLETSQMISNLTGVVDQETLLGELSFVKDPSKVIEALKREKEESVRLLNNSFGTNDAKSSGDIQDDGDINQEK